MVIIEGKDFNKFIIVAFVVCLIGWGVTLFSTGGSELGADTDRTIYDFKNQQYQITVEAERIGGQLGNIGESIQSADQAVERGQAAAEEITGSIERSQQLLGECKELTAENERIFAELGGTAGFREGATEGPDK